jgi:hypothetical protein
MQPEFLQARYANVFRVGHNEHEMIFDFGQADPNGKAEAFHTRIITAAAHGKALLGLLSEAVAHHESSTDESGPESTKVS